MKPRMGKTAYYLLSLTWGLPVTLAGALTAAVLLLTGRRPERWGYAWHFTVGRDWGGASIGPVFLTEANATDRLKNHEFGHSIQNCYFGPLMPLLVSIPSSLRYRLRLLQERRGRRDLPPYDSVWFEGQATRLGTAFMDWYRSFEKTEQ